MTDSETGDRGTYTPLNPGIANPATNPIPPDDGAPAPERRTLRDRLGPVRLSILIGGSAVLLAALIILGLLWKEAIRAADGEPPRKPWVDIFRWDWAPTVVTICAAFIRTAMAFQAGLLTSMLGAIILEAIGAPLRKVPFYSMITAVGAAPYELLSRSIFRSKGPLAVLVYTLIVLEALAILAAQFTSTILVADFDGTRITKLGETIDVPTLETPNLFLTQKWWSVGPPSTWTFAEHIEPPAEEPGLDDTGHTYRAFLPFDFQPQRLTLRDYHGPAVVMDQRVVCATPSLSDLSLIPMGLNAIGLTGIAEPNPDDFPTYTEPEFKPRFNFTCLLPFLPPDTDLEKAPESVICFNTKGPDTIPLEDPLINKDEGIAGTTHFSTESKDGKFDGMAEYTTFIIIDILSASALKSEDNFYFGNVTSVHYPAPWATITNGTSTTDPYALRLTSCVTNLNALTFSVDIHSSDRLRTEPALQWSRADSTFGTDSILRQLGASPGGPRPYDDRGIFDLGPRSTWRDDDHVANSLPSAGFFALSLDASMPTPEANAVTLSRREGLDRSHAHRVHGAVFQDALEDTGSPARAAQAVFARLHQMAYYDQLQQQRTFAPAEAAFTVSVLVPLGYSGFIGAVAIIATHFVVMVIVTALYLGLTRHTLIGHHWQAISNAVSDSTMGVLDRAGGMKDVEIERWAEGRSVDLRRRMTLGVGGDGRVVLGAEKASSSGFQAKPDVEKGGVVSDGTGNLGRGSRGAESEVSEQV